MSNKLTAADALRKWQKQCDPEGIEVQVSRQALDEVLDALEAKDKRIVTLETMVTELEAKLYRKIERMKAWQHESDEHEAALEAMQKENVRVNGLVALQKRDMKAAMDRVAELEKENKRLASIAKSAQWRAAELEKAVRAYLNPRTDGGDELETLSWMIKGDKQ